MAKIIQEINSFLISHGKHSRITKVETECENVLIARENIQVDHESTHCHRNITQVNHVSAQLLW